MLSHLRYACYKKLHLVIDISCSASGFRSPFCFFVCVCSGWCTRVAIVCMFVTSMPCRKGNINDAFTMLRKSYSKVDPELLPAEVDKVFNSVLEDEALMGLSEVQ